MDTNDLLKKFENIEKNSTKKSSVLMTKIEVEDKITDIIEIHKKFLEKLLEEFKLQIGVIKGIVESFANEMKEKLDSDMSDIKLQLGIKRMLGSFPEDKTKYLKK